MILRVDIDKDLEQRDSRSVRDRIKFFEADDWAHALAQISVWAVALQPPPITITIDDRSDVVAAARGEA